MNVEGTFYVNAALEENLFEELRCSCEQGAHGGFMPAVKQLANVAALPGIVSKSIGLPDIHSGYGFAIGNVAAFDMDNPESVVSPGIVLYHVLQHIAYPISDHPSFPMVSSNGVSLPIGGVGFDINCGVRLLRTNLTEKDVGPVKELLAQTLFDHIPVGVGSKGVIPTSATDLNAGTSCMYHTYRIPPLHPSDYYRPSLIATYLHTTPVYAPPPPPPPPPPPSVALEMGIDWSIREGYAWAEDKEVREGFFLLVGDHHYAFLSYETPS